jgi:hypothetical protein
MGLSISRRLLLLPGYGQKKIFALYLHPLDLPFTIPGGY